MIAASNTEICFAFFYQNSNCINSISHHRAIFHPINFGGRDLFPWWCQCGTFVEILLHCYRLKVSIKIPRNMNQHDSNVIPFPGRSLKIFNITLQQKFKYIYGLSRFEDLSQIIPPKYRISIFWVDEKSRMCYQRVLQCWVKVGEIQ